MLFVGEIHVWLRPLFHLPYYTTGLCLCPRFASFFWTLTWADISPSASRRNLFESRSAESELKPEPRLQRSVSPTAGRTGSCKPTAKSE